MWKVGLRIAIRGLPQSFPQSKSLAFKSKLSWNQTIQSQRLKSSSSSKGTETSNSGRSKSNNSTGEDKPNQGKVSTKNRSKLSRTEKASANNAPSNNQKATDNQQPLCDISQDSTSAGPSSHQIGRNDDPSGSSSSPSSRSEVPTSTPSQSFASQMLDLASDLPPPPPEDSSEGASKEKNKKKQAMARIFGSFLVVVTASWVWTLTREWDDPEERRRLGHGEDGDRMTRLRARLYDLSDYFNKPAWSPLLPPPLPEPHGRPYTLLVDLEDLLVHSTWDREHGWRLAKRPGVDYFLSYLAQFYEIVIFTTQPAYAAAPVCEKLDPYGYYSPYKLFRESCLSRGLIKPQLIKDLDYLGRDLKKVIYLETNPEFVQLQPFNGFILPKWTGDPNDTGLVDLIPLLEAIVFNGVTDIRSICHAYQGRDPIKAYAESEARQKKELLEKWEEERERRKSGWNIDLRAIFGLSSHDPEEPPKLLVEKDRARAQQAYLEERKYFMENEPTFKKLLEEDRERQMEEMKGTVLGVLSGQSEFSSLFKSDESANKDKNDSSSSQPSSNSSSDNSQSPK